MPPHSARVLETTPVAQQQRQTYTLDKIIGSIMAIIGVKIIYGQSLLPRQIRVRKGSEQNF